MANQNKENTDYLNFIATLNDILSNEEIGKLSYS
ncbi:hypothetical protein LCGC14_1235700 [marine sediment metagenome]|uniref:Uncharacterized protein n=1 Tax=marine sediment metagenome TaxID=412755 RepID=A0A0F9LBF7_9ZZZZ